MPDKRRVTRRAALGLIAGGGLLAATETLGFSNVTASRGVSIDTASDPNAIVGLDVNGTVQKNQRERLVDVTNNTTETLDVTVSLNTTNQTTLYGPNGSGDTVSFTLLVGDTATVEIETGLKDTTITFDISAMSPGFSFDATRGTTAQAGNVKSAVKVNQVKNFSANTNGNSNDWGIQKVQVQDKDGDDDLDRVEYEITDSNGTTRATRTEGASGGKYQVSKITIQPDDSNYQLQSGETYTLTVTGYDVDGNSDSETRTTTA